MGGAKNTSATSLHPQGCSKSMGPEGSAKQRTVDSNSRSAEQKNSTMNGSKPAPASVTAIERIQQQQRQVQQQQQHHHQSAGALPALVSSGSTPRSSLQARASTNSLVSARRTLHLTREFHVTHTSDNWKLRKAARQQASMEKYKNILEERTKSLEPKLELQNNNNNNSTVISQSAGTFVNPLITPGYSSENADQDNNVQREKQRASHPPEMGKALSPIMDSPELGTTSPTTDSSHHKDQLARSLEGPTRQRTVIGDVLLRIEQREKTILGELPGKAPTAAQPQQTDKSVQTAPYLPSKHSGGDRRLLSEENAKLSETFDEGFGEEDEENKEDDIFVIEDGDDGSSGFSEALPRQKELTSEDFDTDLSDTDTESSATSSTTSSTKLSREKNRTLAAYMTACSKCGLTPNATFMRQCGRATSVDLRHRMLTYRDAKPIAIALVNDRTTSFLDISDNPLGPLGTSYIAEMMSVNKTIMELNLGGTEPGSEGLDALTQTLPYNKHLRRLHLDDNFLQDGDGRHLARLVTTVPDLREVTLNHSTLGFKDGTRIALALASDAGAVSSLSLSYNKIRTESAVQLALSLAKNRKLRILNLSWNGFGADGCRALAKSLKQNTTLKELDLTCNRLGIKSLEHLVQVFKENRGLTKVKLSNNPLTTEGAKAIVVALTEAKESAIEELDLQNIPIDEDFVELVARLREKRAVRVLHDSNVHIGTHDMTKEFDGTNLDRFDPIMVLFEYVKKDNLRVIDLFQFLDQKKRDKLSKGDLRDGVNTLRLPFTEHALDVIMKTLDSNRDGFLTLEDMVKGYKENDRVVKQRRIKANKKGKPDRGLEDLWTIIKDIIVKRKSDNEKRSQAPAAAK